MAGNRRGFTRERHGGTKLAVSLLAVAGFGAVWAGFAGSHDTLPESAQGETTPAATTTVTPTAADTTPAPAAAPTRARRSRGS